MMNTWLVCLAIVGIGLPLLLFFGNQNSEHAAASEGHGETAPAYSAGPGLAVETGVMHEEENEKEIKKNVTNFS